MGAGPTSPLYPPALAYARIRAFGLPFSMLCSAMEGVFRGRGDTRAPLRASFLAASANAILDPLLIFGAPLGLGWGVAGAAVATVVAQGIAFVSMFLTLLPWLRVKSSGAAVGEGAASQAGGPPAAALPPPAAASATSAAAPEAAAPEPLVVSDLAEPRRPPRRFRASGRDAVPLLTIGASLLRSTSILGTWVFITSTISRRLGADAIAAHGVVLKLWLLFVLSAEAPAVASQVKGLQ